MPISALNNIKLFFSDLRQFLSFFWQYLRKKSVVLFRNFETAKSFLVDSLVAKRGRYVRPFLHTSMSGLFLIGLMLVPIIQGALPKNNVQEGVGGPEVLGTTDIGDLMTTQISVKPRDSVVTYIVQPGDTVSEIAQKFGVSVDTIRWQNDLSSIEAIKPGQKLEIPPVTGIVHKVKRGETIYSVAKEYSVDAQAVVNWPFNTFINDETFALAVGQLLIIPDGVKPKEKPWVPSDYMATRQTPSAGEVSATGQFVWPAAGGITQYYRWYHPAIDIANNSAPDILAADSGKVILVQELRYAYGHHVIIDHGNGFTTLYAHMSSIYVSPGQTVARGNAVGKMGCTGRCTGTHLHFEIRQNGVAQDPLAYLK